MKKMYLSTALAALAAGPVFAGGLAEPAPAPVIAPAPVVMAPSADWTGGYVGASIGTYDARVTDGDIEESVADGTLYGVHAGYNFDMGTVVVGGELDYDMGTFESEESDDEADFNILRLKGRVGYDAGSFLPYLTAGVARLNIDEDGGESEDGVVYGIGADFAVTDNILIGAELLRHTFEVEEAEDVDFEIDTMSLRASFKF
eukprot:TRINITY_DN13343_c0_g1_i1.p1 TRINITY_DN13343_c0_g1~~TRINITY_DN13343_c0_g1_i1.p1  ORF type:complete len:202 (+),score=45.34 TRINITY_DN13343_c0_g1_i1:51-656(+)